jgi:hypothetical protein
MSLLDVLHHSVRLDRLEAYEEKIRRLAERAVAKKDPSLWNGFQTAIGGFGNFYYAVPAQDWSEIRKRGTAQELVLRVFGEKEGRQWLGETAACLQAATQMVSVDRPELSYTQGDDVRAPFVMVTAARVRPGQQESFEEFVRKMAEAIPKVNDRWRLATRQVVLGNLHEYRIVSPLKDLAEIDTLLPPERLLTQVFGAAEGGLIYRSGVASIEHAERRILALRPELSNPA